MGNGLAKFADCLSGGGRRRHDMAAVLSDPCFYGEGLGHSFCYVRPDTSPLSLPLSSSKVHHHEESSTTTTTTTFRSISGASVSANTSTTPFSSSSSSVVLLMSDLPPAAAFDCSHSFSSVPLQPIPRQLSGPLSGTMDRGFFSGPIERAFMSGPLDPLSGIFSGPLPLTADDLHQQFQRSFSHGIPRSRKASALLLGLRKAISRTITRGQNTIVAPVKGIVSFSSSSSSKELEVVENEHGLGGQNNSNSNSSGGTNLSGDPRFDDGGMGVGGELQWAQGKAGEDRVHVVISEEHGWVFVGIYDGFNGPDAPDYLLSNLYPAIHAELKGLLWEDHHATTADEDPSSPPPPLAAEVEEAMSGSTRRRREENQRRWKCEWDRERVEHDRKLKEQFMAQPNSDAAEGKSAGVNHSAVLKALATALQRTEETFLGIADNMVGENPELALMGSCVLVMLMKGEDVYLLNVGDSRAVLGHKAEDRSSKARQDLERMKGESPYGWDEMERALNLEALQLTVDHTACAEEEVHRIRREHPDDALAVSNDRVKGSLKVTRAFGAGFLKQPKWNNALLEMFRIYYVGTSPYITCNPSICHRRLSSRDRFLILSSDGLYQYFTNQEAVAEVEMFITTFPDGDPAQHLIEEVLYRAAKEAGLDFHELLQIPQGDRRRYHDDISVIVISLEGRIWRSCV